VLTNGRCGRARHVGRGGNAFGAPVRSGAELK
jgi:hypothetical protein